jgi:hypothetical protein
MVSALGSTRDRRAFSSQVASDFSQRAAKRYDYSLAWRAKTREKQAE